MATTYSVQATKQYNAATAYAPIGADELGGKLRRAYFAYRFTAAEVTNDILRLVKLPPGSRVTGIFVARGDLGTTCTVDIGDTTATTSAAGTVAADPDRLATALAWGAASTAAYEVMRHDNSDTDENPALGYGFKYLNETWIDATFTTIGTPAAGTVRGHIDYTVD